MTAPIRAIMFWMNMMSTSVQTGYSMRMACLGVVRSNGMLIIALGVRTPSISTTLSRSEAVLSSNFWSYRL